MKNLKYIAFAILSTLGLLLSACAAGNSAAATPTTIPTVLADKAIIAEGRVEPIHYADIALNASGLVSEVFNEEGDSVEAGQVIASLENSQAQTLESAQAQASQELTTAYQDARDAQYELDNFDIPFDFTDMTPTQAVEVSLEKLNKARDDFEPYKYLSDRRLKLTNREIDTGVYEGLAHRYKKALDDAWADYRKAIQWLELEANLEAAQARVAQAQKDYDSLQDTSFSEDTAGVRAALANAEVRAPFSGTITNLDLKVGEYAASGQPVVTIADLSNWVVKTTDLTEIDVVNVNEGQPVTMTLDAIPDVTLRGNVLSIGQAYSEKQGDIVYEVTILLTDKNPAMRWGMTAEVKFEP